MSKEINLKQISFCLIMLLFSLSCDETEPIVVEDPVNVYSLSIASQINHCSKVGCIEDESGNTINNEAYNAAVVAPSNFSDGPAWYHMFFQIQQWLQVLFL